MIYILISLNLFIPIVVSAAFGRDLYFGLSGDPEVTKLQEFLRGQGVYSGPITGGFFSLTREGVKKFQTKEGINPAAGYFGPLTRGKANSLQEKIKTPDQPTAAEVTLKIKELQTKLENLQAELAKPAFPVPPVEESKPVVTPPAEVKETPKPSGKVTISGTATIKFPEAEVTPFKIGEFTIKNASSSDVLFGLIESIVSDEMDSTANRNQKIYLLLREGSLATDPLISKTEFTFVLSAPKSGEPHKVVVNIPFGAKVLAGKEKNFSLWAEQLKYVRSGTLEIYTSRIGFTTPGMEVEGGFSLALTREPPL